MERHHRGVGEAMRAAFDIHLQDAVFRRRVPAVGPEEVLHGVVVDTLGPVEAHTEHEKDGGTFDTQGVGRAGERESVEWRPPRQVEDHAHGLGLALERGPSGRGFQVRGAVAVQGA
jgi:hypothetical protein